jgi:uncharacterized protein (DUF736 family)
MSTADSITCTMQDGATHVIDCPAGTTAAAIRRTLAERTEHPLCSIELIHAEGELADREIVARGAELTVMIKPAPLLLPGMEDTPEYREELYNYLLKCGTSHNTNDGLQYSMLIIDDDEQGLKYVRAAIFNRDEGEEHYSFVWECESKRSNNPGRLGDMAYEMACKLMRAVRDTRECNRCAKRRRIMKGTEHCMGCLLAPLEEEQ